MNSPSSVLDRLWGWLFSALGLILAANVVWLLVRPLLPVAIVVGLGRSFALSRGDRLVWWG